MIYYHTCINKYCNWLLINCLGLNDVVHSREFNNKMLLIGLMAVCDELIIRCMHC